LFTAGESNPWNVVKWKSDSNGKASGNLDFSDFKLGVSGKAIVVHLPDGTRAGCGTIAK
jgi:hypothetical protein